MTACLVRVRLFGSNLDVADLRVTSNRSRLSESSYCGR